MKAFDAIMNSVALELQRTPVAKVKITLETEGAAPDGFADVVRDNVRQLQFKSDSTGRCCSDQIP